MTLVPQLGMVELLVLGMIALIVVGPKDLPKLMHSAGKAMGRIRAMADEFRAGFRQMAKEAEIEEMRREIESLKKASIDDDVRSAMDDIGSAAKRSSKTADTETARTPSAAEEPAGSDDAAAPAAPRRAEDGGTA